LLISSFSDDPDTHLGRTLLRRVDLDGNAGWLSTTGPGMRMLPTDDGGFIGAGGAFSAETRGDFAAIRYGPPPPPCGTTDPCRADATGDCLVDIADLAVILANFGQSPALGLAPANGDIDIDTDVDMQDLVGVLSAMGTNCR